MKIALIAPTALPARRANTFQVMKMAQALAANGHAVRVAVPGRPLSLADEKNGLNAASTTRPDWRKLAQHYGLRLQFPVEWLPVRPRLHHYDFAMRAVWWARRWQADVVYTRLPQAAALASLLHIPTILEVHDLPQGLGGVRMFRLFLSGRGARRLVVISRTLADDLARQFGARVDPPFTLVAPDGVDLARYSDLPEPEAARAALFSQLRLSPAKAQESTTPFTPRTFTAGYTGHLYPGRGIDLLLRLATRLPEMLFLIVGGEPAEVKRWQAEAEAMRTTNLVFTGFIPNADLPRYQAACDVLLMPYQRHVAASSGGDIARYLSPMKLFEYLACGRAILSSDLPVLREVLSAQNAILLPPDDLEAWVAALIELSADPQRRRGLAKNARHDAEKYTWEARASLIFAR